MDSGHGIFLRECSGRVTIPAYVDAIENGQFLTAREARALKRSGSGEPIAVPMPCCHSGEPSRAGRHVDRTPVGDAHNSPASDSRVTSGLTARVSLTMEERAMTFSVACREEPEMKSMSRILGKAVPRVEAR
jgi:hypothetical protein